LKKQADEAPQLHNFFKAVLYSSSFENINIDAGCSMVDDGDGQQIADYYLTAKIQPLA
jgi:hypothetical protein